MDTIKQSFDLVAEQARQDGAQVEMLLSGGENLTLKYQNQKLEAFEATQSQIAGLRVLFQKQQGYAYTEKIEGESLLQAYKEALNNAKTVQKKEAVEITLPGPSKIPILPDAIDNREISLNQKMEKAQQIETLCLGKDKRIQTVPTAAVVEVKGFKRILNSNGLDQKYESGAYMAWAYPVAKEGESTKRKGSSRSRRHFQDLDIDDLTSEAVTKSVELLGAGKLQTGQYPVVICGEQAGVLLSMISEYFSAKLIDEKKSLFKDKMNQKVGSPKWNLVDDPFNVNGMGARPFDDEGSPSQRTVLLESGTVKNFLTNVEYAKKMNLPLTAHASRSPTSEMEISTSNLYLALGTATREELLKKYPAVVLIKDFTAALHSSFKSLTGDVSMPCEGVLYENGKPVKAVEQFILSSNIMDLLMKTEDVGDRYMKSSSRNFSPDLLISSVGLAGG